MEVWKSRESQIKDVIDDLDFQIASIRDLVAATKCPVIDMDEVKAVVNSIFAEKAINILQFRDKSYTSSTTGTTAVPYKL